MRVWVGGGGAGGFGGRVGGSVGVCGCVGGGGVLPGVKHADIELITQYETSVRRIFDPTRCTDL